MLIGSNFIYLELLKTASSHTRKILESIPDLEFVAHGKHTTLQDLPKTLEWKNKTIIGNVRNPWDWYVSHWAFGCMQRGGLHKRLQNHRLNRFFKSPFLVLSQYQRFAKNTDIFKTCYTDPANHLNFKKWLDFVLHHPTKDVEHGYHDSNAYKQVGLYTYEFLKMFSPPDYFSSLMKDPQAMNAAEHPLILDHAIHAEDLEEDLLSLGPQLGIPTESLKAIIDSNAEKTNPSIRNSYSEYYDEESRSWIENKDSFIISNYNYRF